MSRQISRYGWKPSLPDYRDAVHDPAGITVLPEVDPRADMPNVYDQGQLGSCTANAVGGALQYDRTLDGLAKPKSHRPARLFIYYCERDLEGSLGQGDTGAYGRDGFKAAAKWGVPYEEAKYWPYVESTYANPPSAEMWSVAAKHKLTKTYAAVNPDQQSIMAALSNQQTVAFGFTVYDSFEYSQTMDSGIVPMPGRNESQLGGHECLIVGYLQAEPNYALVRNSWGTGIYMGVPGSSVTQGGYFLMPWKYITDQGLSSDWRTIVRA